MFSKDQRFSVLIIAVSALKIAEFLLCNNTDHGCFSSETVIFIEIHAICINYQFWIILKNLVTSLNQSGVSMIISENSKDVNPGLYIVQNYCFMLCQRGNNQSDRFCPSFFCRKLEKTQRMKEDVGGKSNN